MALKDSYYTVVEASKEIGVTRQTIYRWIKNGTLKAEQIGRETIIEKGEITRYKESKITDWLIQGFNYSIENNNYKNFREFFNLSEKDDIRRIGDAASLNYMVFSDNEEPRVITVWHTGTSYNKKTGHLETSINPDDITIEPASEFQKKIKRERKRKNKGE